MHRPSDACLERFTARLAKGVDDLPRFAESVGEVLNEATGGRVGKLRVPDPKAIVATRKIRIVDELHAEIAKIPFNQNTVLQDLAATAVFAVQRRIRIRCIQALARAGRKEAWRDADGVNMFHPAAYALLTDGKRMRPLQMGQASHSTQKAVPGAGSGKPLRLVLHPGTPLVDWAPRRPSRLEIAMWLPESMLAGLGGTPLRDVLGASLTGRRKEEYDAIVVRSAKRAGSEENPKTILELEPVRQALADPPEDVLHLLAEHRAKMEATAVPI